MIGPLAHSLPIFIGPRTLPSRLDADQSPSYMTSGQDALLSALKHDGEG